VRKYALLILLSACGGSSKSGHPDAGPIDGTSSMIDAPATIDAGPPLPVPRFAYVDNDTSITIHAVDPTTGALRIFGQYFISEGGIASPAQISPDGRFIAVPSNQGLHMIAVDSLTGWLSAAPGSPSGGGALIGKPSWDPSGQYLYGGTTGKIVVWSVGSDGGVTKSDGPTTPSLAADLVVQGHFLYASGFNDGQSIIGYSIGATGTLTQQAGFPISAGPTTNPNFGAADASGKYVAFTLLGSEEIAVYAVDPATGALTQVPGSPMATGAAPRRGSFDPTGRFFYVPNENSDSVSGFGLDPTTGALSPLPGSPYVVGTSMSPTVVTVDAAGKLAYVGVSSGTMTMAIGADGSLGAPMKNTTAQGPTSVIVTSGTSPVAMQPRFAYIVNGGSNSISSFTMDPSTGALATIAGSTPSITNPYMTAADPQGKYLYAVDNIDGVHGYQIGSNGALQELSGSPFAGGANSPEAIAVNLTGDFLYLARNATAMIEGYRIDRATGSLLYVGAWTTSGTAPVMLAVTPLGTQLWATNKLTGDVANYQLEQDGSLTQNASLFIGASSAPAGIAFSGDGNYGYVALSGTEAIAGFQLGFTDTPLIGSPFAADMLADLAVAADWNGHLFVTNSGSVFTGGADGHQVFAMTIDPSTGALSMISHAIANVPPHPAALAVDPSGKYLLVASMGTFSPTVAGGLSEFAIDPSTGDLTALPGAMAGDVPEHVTIVGGAR
jgi:6-phosphogluconolactonase (cycloisomerase 2 family)